MKDSAYIIKAKSYIFKEKEIVDLHLEIKSREDLGLDTKEKKEKLDYLKELKNIVY